MKKILATVTALAMLLMPSGFNVSAEGESVSLPTGGAEEFELVELSPEEAEAADSYIDSLNNEDTGIALYSARAADPLFEYDYRYDYFYNQLNADEKALYRGLYDAAMEILYSDIDYEPSEDTYNSAFCGEVLFFKSISYDRANEIYRAFRFSNPQFFFFGTCAFYGGYSIGGGSSILYSHIYLRVGEAFLKAAPRKAMLNTIAQKTSLWLSEITVCQNPLEKELKIIDIMCSNIMYDHNALSDINVNAEYHQTIAGAIGLGKCVCNGYAMAFVYLCHLADIDSIGVVGTGHAWNRVNLFGDWYEVDVTWSDQDWGISYKWCNKSTATFLAQDTASHTPRADLYAGLALPSCVKDNPVVPAGWTDQPRPAPDPDPAPTVTITDEEAKTVVTAVNNTVNRYNITNSTTEADIQAAADSAVKETGISEITADISAVITPATESSYGRADITISYIVGGIVVKEYAAGKNFPFVSGTDINSVCNAVYDGLRDYPISNSTTEAKLQEYADGIIADTGIKGVTTKVTLAMTPATKKTKGSATISTVFYANGKQTSNTASMTRSFYWQDSQLDSVNPGDVNEDGKVNAADLLILRRYIVHLRDNISPAADMNGDGKINAADLLKLRRYIVHL